MVDYLPSKQRIGVRSPLFAYYIPTKQYQGLTLVRGRIVPTVEQQFPKLTVRGSNPFSPVVIVLYKGCLTLVEGLILTRGGLV